MELLLKALTVSENVGSESVLGIFSSPLTDFSSTSESRGWSMVSSSPMNGRSRTHSKVLSQINVD